MPGISSLMTSGHVVGADDELVGEVVPHRRAAIESHVDRSDVPNPTMITPGDNSTDLRESTSTSVCPSSSSSCLRVHVEESTTSARLLLIGELPDLDYGQSAVAQGYTRAAVRRAAVRLLACASWCSRFPSPPSRWARREPRARPRCSRRSTTSVAATLLEERAAGRQRPAAEGRSYPARRPRPHGLRRHANGRSSGRAG